MNPTELSEARDTRKLRKTIHATISFGSAVVVACTVMMWSTFNTWTNVLTFWNNELESQAWWIAAIMILLTCVVPFGLGIWLLLRTIAKYKP